MDAKRKLNKKSVKKTCKLLAWLSKKFWEGVYPNIFIYLFIYLFF